MAVCGCGDRCTCAITPGDGIVVTGSGDATDPFVISSAETVFSAANTDNAVAITPGGSYGHYPVFNVNVSSDAGNMLTKHSDGLYIGSIDLAVASRYIGELIDITGISTPSLTLETDGSEYAVASYPSLAAAYGSVGDGITYGLWDCHPNLGCPALGNFRVPDMRDRATIGRGTFAGAVGTTDAITEASRSNTHSHTADGTLATDTITADTGNANGVDPTNFHAGYILNESGHDSLVSDGDLSIDNSDFAPGSDNNPDNFTKVQHTHDFSHDHDVTGSTSDYTIPYATVRKVVFAGV